MKVLFIVNSDGALYNFRKPILKRLIARGHQVFAITGDSPEGSYRSRIEELGVTQHNVSFDSRSASPLKALGLFVEIGRIVRRVRPDVVHCFTHKAAVFGTLAARLVGVRCLFVTVTGLGSVFVRDDSWSKVLRMVLLGQYRLACLFLDKMYFQNPDDLEYFVGKGIIRRQKAVLTYGSGIDLEEYSLPSTDVVDAAKRRLSAEIGVDVAGRVVVLLPARCIPEKGYEQYYHAAKMIGRLEVERYVFVHIGSFEVRASACETEAEFSRYAQSNDVHYLGYRHDAKAYLTAADIVCLPSYYREGVPRSLIEALALGKVVVTSDTPGCRETVINGWNGYLCRARQNRSLIESILSVDRTFVSLARRRSRAYGESRFAASWLADVTVEDYERHCDVA
jgi:N,N'-diacetylbacillosaminyl-diphospho-undecaprenol alpha-1,3-N-acetylgalactosaminyltransferase